MRIDELYFPWETKERKRERQRRTAAVPKCSSCNQRTHNGVCTSCRERRKEAERQRVLQALADRLLDKGR